jgi:dipeptidyl-peptidase-4
MVLGWRDAPTEQHLFRVWYDGRDAQRLTDQAGWHEVVISANGRHWADRLTSLSQPPDLGLRSFGSGSDARPAPNALAEGHPYHGFLDAHVTPQLGTLAAEDGQQLHFRLTLPVGFDSSRRYPVLVNVYGGPGVQRVRNEWAPLTLQLFARAGIAIFELDNRGGGNRAKAFEDPLHGRLGEVEVTDQLRGVDYLRSLDWVDASRIGVLGHSYGGYLTLLCLARGAGIFRCGISVAPVTDWRLYDSHYTERYLGTPDANPEGYAASNAIEQLEGIDGALLVIHGMADDNVLFRHSTLLFKALQDRHQRFEMMTYPGAKHALQERDVAIHRYQTMLDFLHRELIR